MILTFGDKETERIYKGIVSLKLPFDIQNIARRKLRMINSSQHVEDLKAPTGNRLEKLNGSHEAYHSIRINNRWRIIFIWEDNLAKDVKIIDYHD